MRHKYRRLPGALAAAAALAALAAAPAQAATTTYSASADTYVRNDQPTANFGTQVRMSVEGDILRESLLKFAVTVPAGETVTSATLRLFTESLTGATTVTAHPATGSWTESGVGGVTWNTKPTLGSQLDTESSFTAGAFSDWNVTSAVTGTGTVQLGLKGTDPDYIGFRTREFSTAADPELVVTTTTTVDTTPPTVTLTSPAAGTVSGNVSLGLTATDNSGTVSEGKWFLDDGVNPWIEIGYDGSSPFSATWNSATVADGTYTLFAKANDPSGNWGTSSGVTVTVDNVANSVQCNDGVDNDSDGLTDYPADPGCSSAADDSEANSASTVFAAVGDICGGSTCTGAPAETAQTIAAMSPYRFLGLGDYQYQNAGAGGATFQTGYQSKFGSLAGITIPTFGATHDTDDGSGSWEGYPVSYFNANGASEAAGHLSEHQWGYSFDVGAWHVLVFNYRTAEGGSVASVTADLDANPSACLLAIDHAPVIGSPSSEHPSNEASAFRTTLVNHGVDLVLNGHQHFYERNADPAGFTAITNGEGGVGHYSRTSTASTAVAYDNASFGALKVTLDSNAWSTQFNKNATAAAFTDAASGDCA